MRNFFLISNVLLLLLSGTDSHVIRGVNVTNILLQYTLVCGYDYVCNKTYIRQYPNPQFTYRETSICPKCYCHDFCLETANCCADKFLTTAIPKCRSVSLFQDGEPKAYWMIDHCLDGASEAEKNSCARKEDGADLLTSLPVTAYRSGITYANEHCAKCNRDFEYSKWTLDFDCKRFVDFNFLSSYQEVWDMAKQKKCQIYYKTPEDVHIYSDCIVKDDSIAYTKCNMTGLWSSYDPDIEWACNNYGVRYRVFKNIFCYICNPSRSSLPYIDTCNNFDSMKEETDNGFVEACLKLPSTSATYPFKNIFCFFCNVGHVSDSTKLDIKMNSIVESFSDSKFMYYFGLYEFNGDYFSSKSPTSDNMSIYFENFYQFYSLFEQDVFHRDQTLVNMTELIFQYLSYTGKFPLANPLPIYIPYSLLATYCDRYEQSIFENSDQSCIDVVLRYPFTCLSNFNLSPVNTSDTKEPFYYVTDKCWRQNVTLELKSKCESPNMNDILSLIPVTSYNYIEYRNWYCFICNEHHLSNWDVSYLERVARGYKLWNLEVTCQSYLDYAHYPTIYDVIKAATDQQCTIHIKPSRSSPYGQQFCNRGTGFVNKCKKPYSVSRSVVWACEHLSHPVFPPVEVYKNMFCKICNTEVDKQAIGSCNITGHWSSYDPVTETGCLSLPPVSINAPYKNIFCVDCNGAVIPAPLLNTTTVPSLSTTGLGSKSTTEGGKADVSFRSIFALESYNEDETQEIVTGPKCRLKHQIYDPYQDICRNQSCFPGKLLVNDTCIPLFRFTSNLGYILALRIRVNIDGFLDLTVHEFLSNIKTVLTAKLQSVVETSSISILSFYALSQLECKISLLNVSEFYIKIYIKFYILSNVERLKTELNLQDLSNTTSYFTIKNAGVYIHSFQDIDSLYLPLKLQFAVPHQCAMIETVTHAAVSSLFYRAVYVSKLLTCIQLELENDEFRTDSKTLQLLLTFANNFSLPFDKFHLLPNGKSRVCFEDFPSKEDILIEKLNTKILAYLTLISTIVSLCCLFFTFLTYCLFPQLRTIPGKNNMILVFSIIVSRILLQFGLFQTSIPILCIIISLLTHLFWLSMFGCMFVCSFHMYYVFRGIQLPMERQQGNKVVLRYVALSFGLPALIVTTNTCVYLGLSKGVDTGYGEGKCFINDKLSYLLSFLLPILLVCVLNVAFFAITLIKIKSMPKVQCSAHDRNEFSIYLKLFTLTGITWLLQVVDSFFSVSALSYVVVILNGFQGLFIFISYTCNHRVLKLYREKFFKSDYSFSSNTHSSSVTRTTLVNTISASNSPTVKHQNTIDNIDLKMLNIEDDN